LRDALAARRVLRRLRATRLLSLLALLWLARVDMPSFMTFFPFVAREFLGLVAPSGIEPLL
jgi:hypothetical protein